MLQTPVFENKGSVYNTSGHAEKCCCENMLPTLPCAQLWKFQHVQFLAHEARYYCISGTLIRTVATLLSVYVE